MTGWTLYTLKWDLMQHPPYSLDMAPSDYNLFSYLQLHFNDTIFHSNDEVIKVVDRFLDLRTPLFFAEGNEKFPKRWQTFADLDGD